MPSSSQKGTGKKGAGIIRQRSRNTTPASSIPPPAPTVSLPPVDEVDTEYLEVAAKLHLFQPITYDDLVDPISPNALIPDSKTLDAVINRLKQFGDLIEKRSLFCDLAMRAISQARSNEMQAQAHTDTAGKGSSKKKRKAIEPPPPDRSSPHRSSGKNARKHSRDDSASSSLSPVSAGAPSNMDIDDKPKAVEDDSESSDEDDGRPPPRQQPKERTFGEDPSTFPDPTVYEIRDTTPGMSEEEKKQIYSVAVYPKSDLADRIAGDPPDKDFSSAKPSNQISFSTFSTYVDPYFRPFTEEDLAFLRERNDRISPFVTPKRGKKHYTEIWAEEDGNLSASSPPSRERLPPNQPRGNIEQMDDEVAETDKLSLPPMVSRLLAAMRPEGRPPPSDDRPMTNGINGDSANGDLDTAMIDPVFGNGEDGKPYPPATFFPESNNESFRKGTFNRLDYNSMDERLKQELLYVGLASEDRPEPDYDAAYDDEVSARLRLLQERLRQQILVNGARKARLTELVKERLAFQEYQTILEDLDGQVQAAYLKRTRTMGKSKKKSRPGQAVPVANTARPGIGDLTKTLMERRRKWIESVGPVVADEGLGKVPRMEDPDSSIFKPEVMADLIKKEKISWDEDVEEE